MKKLDLLCIAVVALLFGAAIYGIAFAKDVSVRNAGGVTLSATPAAIGTSAGRIDLILYNDNDSTDAMFCGYSSADLSSVAGATSGMKINPGVGRAICVFPDKPVYCMTTGSATAYFDESFMAAETPTVTPTP